MSNCQTIGLANCIQSQTSIIEVSGLDTSMFNSSPRRLNSRMTEFNKLLIYQDIKKEVPKAKFDKISTHISLPIFTFRAYHPDLIYIFDRGKPLSGPISHYHSAIAFACYLKGINLIDAKSHFAGCFYEKCGYFDLWISERDRILTEFQDFGLDMRPYFRDWGRKKAFMYSYNHPRIQPIYDMASALLESSGFSPHRSDLIPHDNLASSAIFAVYPEVGEALGIQGQYEFRAVGDYRPISLTEYLGRCYALYQTIPIGNLEPFPEFKAQVDHILALL